jgi:two-component system, chemotaxis family, chemotaxis protein CheY
MKKTILVVDDFASVRNFICDILERRGYETISASGGLEAFQLLLDDKGKIDLVLSDYNMPDCNGYDLLTMIKAHDGMTSIPVVFFTTENDPEKIQKATQAGLSAWIKKPFRPEIFFSKLEYIISNKPVRKSC